MTDHAVMAKIDSINTFGEILLVAGTTSSGLGFVSFFEKSYQMSAYYFGFSSLAFISALLIYGTLRNRFKKLLEESLDKNNSEDNTAVVD